MRKKVRVGESAFERLHPCLSVFNYVKLQATLGVARGDKSRRFLKGKGFVPRSRGAFWTFSSPFTLIAHHSFDFESRKFRVGHGERI